MTRHTVKVVRITFLVVWCGLLSPFMSLASEYHRHIENGSALINHTHSTDIPAPKVRMPDIASWRNWSEDDYRAYFLSKIAAVTRLKGKDKLLERLSPVELASFMEPIRDRIREKFSAKNPATTVLIRAHKEEAELIPTLASYAMSRVPDGGAELVIVDNASPDRTNEIIRAAGAKCVECPRKGIGYATRAGYEASASSAEFVFISDADVRLTRPFDQSTPFQEGTVLQTSQNFMDLHPKMMGVSSGMDYDATHWSHALMRYWNARRRGLQPISYWTGPNQFFRKEALDACGGINERVEFGYGEDMKRLHAVKEYCKENELHLADGKKEKALRDPVYQSGRRFATLSLTLHNIIKNMRNGKRKLDAQGRPIFEENGVVTKLEVR